MQISAVNKKYLNIPIPLVLRKQLKIIAIECNTTIMELAISMLSNQVNQYYQGDFNANSNSSLNSKSKTNADTFSRA